MGTSHEHQSFTEQGAMALPPGASSAAGDTADIQNTQEDQGSVHTQQEQSLVEVIIRLTSEPQEFLSNYTLNQVST